MTSISTRQTDRRPRRQFMSTSAITICKFTILTWPYMAKTWISTPILVPHRALSLCSFLSLFLSRALSATAMAFKGRRNPSFLSLLLVISLLSIASAKVFFEERFDGTSLSLFSSIYTFQCSHFLYLDFDTRSQFRFDPI